MLISVSKVLNTQWLELMSLTLMVLSCILIPFILWESILIDQAIPIVWFIGLQNVHTRAKGSNHISQHVK